jgi:hypothetical protein
VDYDRGDWDVWPNLPPDPWLGWLATARDAKAMAAIWARMLRETKRG